MRDEVDIKELARHKWPALLGAHMTERMLSGRHGPCPVCGTPKDKFRFTDRGGDGEWICVCAAGDGVHLLQALNGWDFRQARDFVREQAGRFKPRMPAGPQRSDPDRREILRRMWGEARRIEQGDPVWQYLERRCGITAAPAGLRTHLALPYVDDDGVITLHPAMLAQVLDNGGASLTIHRTYLSADGQKADVKSVRKLTTPPRKMDSAAIRLAPIADGWLGVAEGVETALCASARHKVPVWSCVSAGMMVKFRPPPEVKLLTVFGDNDRSYTGQAAAYELARAVTALGVECKVAIPELGDWADK